MKTSTLMALAAALVLPLSAAASTPQELLVGTWQAETLDKETRVSELTRIEFGKDGRYTAYLQLSPFRFNKVGAGGRYAVKTAGKQSFVLTVQRKADDPDVDPDEMSDSDTITIVDEQTLRASDGSLLRRVK